MWFRIETNKDGSVKTCTEVESSLTDGVRVFYVEADSREEAIAILLRQYRRANVRSAVRSRSRERLNREAGLCGCGRRPAADYKTCDNCRARSMDWYRRLKSGELARKEPVSDEMAVVLQLERRKKHAAAVKERSKKRTAYIAGKLRELRLALQMFDEMTPRSFRTWLAERIEALEARTPTPRKVWLKETRNKSGAIAFAKP